MWESEHLCKHVDVYGNAQVPDHSLLQQAGDRDQGRQMQVKLQLEQACLAAVMHMADKAAGGGASADPGGHLCSDVDKHLVHPQALCSAEALQHSHDGAAGSPVGRQILTADQHQRGALVLGVLDAHQLGDASGPGRVIAGYHQVLLRDACGVQKQLAKVLSSPLSEAVQQLLRLRRNVCSSAASRLWPAGSPGAVASTPETSYGAHEAAQCCKRSTVPQYHCALT